MTKSFQIRTAGADAADQLTQLAERTFRDTFSKDNAPEDMAVYLREAFTVGRIRSELESDANTFLVAFANADEPIGYAKLRTDRTPASVTGSTPIELERLYVDQRWIGCGVGSRLIQASLDTAQALGCQTIWLGVWEKNARAIAFYQKWGFEVVGTHVFVLGADHQRDYTMARSVNDGAV